MKINVLHDHMFYYRIFIKHTPVYFFFYILQSVLKSISYILLLQYSIMIVVDGVNDEHMMPIIIQLTVIFLFSVVLTLLQGLFDYNLTPLAREKMERVLFGYTFDVLRKADVKLFEDAKFYNKISIVSDINIKAFEVLNCLASLCGCIIGIIGLSSFFIMLSPFALVIVILVFTLTIINRTFIDKYKFIYDMDTIPFRREKNYLEKIFFDEKYINEIKLNDIKDFLLKKFGLVNVKLIQKNKRNAKKLFWLGGLVPYIIEFFIGNIVYNAVLIYQVMITQTLTIGGFAALFFASTSLLGRLNEISFAMLHFRQLSLFISKIREVLTIQSQLNNGGKSCPKTVKPIKLQNVVFAYDQGVDIIRDLNLEIEAASKVAIVGQNGEGKSTLVKLILRLYDPQQGSLTLGNTDIKEYDLHDYRDLYGTLFQDFNVYYLPLADNIVMDRVLHNTNIKQKVSDALAKSGLGDRLDLQMNTVLTKEYDINGTNLSKGEEQKIAMARIVYSDKNYIVLDEPSASLDPISEYNFNQQVAALSKGKTLIMISHRLSTTRNTDKIIVLQDGVIVEQGSHKELMNNQKLYSKMYKMQASKYSEWNV